MNFCEREILQGIRNNILLERQGYEDGSLYRQGQHRIPLHCFPCDAESRGELYFAG